MNCQRVIKFQEFLWGKPASPTAFLILGLLLPFSWLYKAFVFARNKSYDWELFRSGKPSGTVVISVGNIAVGGTGKTPVTLCLAKELSRTASTAILTRGYRSPAEKMELPLVQSRGMGPQFPASLCGDEPYLLSNRLPAVKVLVGHNRRKAAAMAKELGAEMLILDDGMQHRGLERDLEVVVVDGKTPLESGRCLPAGRLREGPCSLKRAHLIVANHVADEKQWEQVKKMVAPYTNAPVVGGEMRITKFLTLDNRPYEEELAGRRAALFCAIGSPKRFEEQMAERGALITCTFFKGDHAPFSHAELDRYAQQAKERGAELLICTEKDAVKLAPDMQLPLPILWAEAEMVLLYGKEEWTALIEHAIRER